MIIWRMLVLNSDSHEESFDLLATTEERYQLKETDSIQFLVTLSDEKFNEVGEPIVLISDIPVEMEVMHLKDNERTFSSIAPLGNHLSRYFYNCFGESEICLSFSKEHKIHSAYTVNILARADNARLANEILCYITDNFEDAVAVCFSRSKISGGYSKDNSFQFSRLDIIEKALAYLSDALPIFIREHKYSWQPEMQFSERGQPIGPDSVYWVLSNLDRLSPASTEHANLIYNGRGYSLDILPKEGITNNHDVFENRVIHTFLHDVKSFLIELKDSFKISNSPLHDFSNNDFVRFDHTMQKYVQLALKHKSIQLDALLISVNRIQRTLSKFIPAKIIPGIQPKMTSYVSKHIHYRTAFNFIEQCHSAPAPTFEGKNVLLGLKNLSIVYEISSLLMLNELIKKCFTVETIEQSYRSYSKEKVFGGVRIERPYGEVNNYFLYRSDVYDIEMLYEPKIYPYSTLSKAGDLVDTSDTRPHKIYGEHHFCPDFIIKINSKRWRKAITLVLDAKYKDAATIKRYDIDELTKQYLLNIHQVNENGRLGVSPIQLLLLLFAHDRSGTIVRTVAPRHCLTGTLPVLPQACAVLLKPSNMLLLDQQFRALVEIMGREYI
ncbi:hypothetical protein [Aeromonas sp. 602293]|uniref:hypothetical protein n=1 Tax=Aeromonas sp. 602293 TaxID=2712041 RepID=UPI003B9F1140